MTQFIKPTVFSLLFFGVFACGGTQKSLSESTHIRARKDVLRSVDAAHDTAESVERVVTLLRWNPASCDCPDNELFLYGHWTRCEIGGDESPLANLEAFVTRADAVSVGSFLRVEGQLLDEEEERAGRTFCVFEISKVEDVFSTSKSKH